MKVNSLFEDEETNQNADMDLESNIYKNLQKKSLINPIISSRKCIIFKMQFLNQILFSM